jgi:hypothetical protein
VEAGFDGGRRKDHFIDIQSLGAIDMVLVRETLTANERTPATALAGIVGVTNFCREKFIFRFAVTFLQKTLTCQT